MERRDTYPPSLPNDRSEARALARSRRDAMRRRLHRIRRGIAGLTAALFATAFLVVYVQLASGHDPALSTKAATTAIGTSASSSGTETSTSSSTPTTSSETSTGSSSSDKEPSSESSSSSGSESSQSPSAVTTSQS